MGSSLNKLQPVKKCSDVLTQQESIEKLVSGPSFHVPFDMYYDTTIDEWFKYLVDVVQINWITRKEIKYLCFICAVGHPTLVEGRLMVEFGYWSKDITCSFIQREMRQRKRTILTNNEISLLKKHMIMDEFGFIRGCNDVNTLTTQFTKLKSSKELFEIGCFDQLDIEMGLLFHHHIADVPWLPE